MKIELQKELHDRFEFLHYPYYSDVACPVFIECGDGWFELIWDLCKEIEYELGNEPKEFRREFAVIQIKEKYGALRFYTTYGNDKIFELIENAEKKSTEICEECGRPGEPKGMYWVQTLCDECWSNK